MSKEQVRKSMNTPTFTYADRCVCVYIYIYTHIHTYIQTNATDCIQACIRKLSNSTCCSK